MLQLYLPIAYMTYTYIYQQMFKVLNANLLLSHCYWLAISERPIASQHSAGEEDMEKVRKVKILKKIITFLSTLYLSIKPIYIFLGLRRELANDARHDPRCSKLQVTVICLSVRLHVYLSVCLISCLSVCPIICLSIYIRLSSPSIFLIIHLLVPFSQHLSMMFTECGGTFPILNIYLTCLPIISLYIVFINEVSRQLFIYIPNYIYIYIYIQFFAHT